MRCALLLADAGQRRLQFVAAPSIPEDYKRSMAPHLLIAPDMGSCGTAAYARRAVYTKDTSTDPLWRGCSAIATRNGLRAVWSTPILSTANEVLGTFAMYYSVPRLPTQQHIELIEMATQLARVAIEVQYDRDLMRVVFEGAPVGILVRDLAGTIAKVNYAFAAMLGYTPAELRGKRIAEIEAVENASLTVGEFLAQGRHEITSNRRYRSKGGEVLLSRERSALRRDSSGKPRFVVTHVDNMSAAMYDTVLGIAPASVDTYRSRIMAKLKIEDVPGLVRFAIQQGITSI